MQSIPFQCYSTGCLQIWATLLPEQRTLKYCSHLKDASFAFKNKQFASEHLVKIADLVKLNVGEAKLTKFKEASTDDQIRVYSAPGNNLIVPSFTTTSHSCPLPFIHLRNKICPLLSCKGKQKKHHALQNKEPVLCVHVICFKFCDSTRVSLFTRKMVFTYKRGKISPWGQL